MTVGRILQPGQKDLAWRRGVDKQLRDEKRTGQLIEPSAWPASPFGGAAPPSTAWYIAVTSAVFSVQAAQPWVVQLDTVTHRGFRISVPWTTDAATTGEVRLLMTGAANSPSSVKTVAAASSGILKFNWLHGWEPYFSSDVWITIEARRTGGAGNVNIGYPLGGGIQVGPKGMLTTG